MLRLVSDEDFRGKIVRGLMRKQPDLDLVRVQEVGLRGKIDEIILEWAASEQRVVLTHDRNTMTQHVKNRIAAMQVVSGIIVVNQQMKVGQAIDEILLAAHCSQPNEWQDKILFIPL